MDVASQFVGYEYEQVNNTEIVFMFADDKPVTKLTNTTGYIILKETPFYAEKGGQAADHGLILKDNTTAYVLDVQQGPNKQHLHFVKVEGHLRLVIWSMLQLIVIVVLYSEKSFRDTFNSCCFTRSVGKPCYANWFL